MDGVPRASPLLPAAVVMFAFSTQRDEMWVHKGTLVFVSEKLRVLSNRKKSSADVISSFNVYQR